MLFSQSGSENFVIQAFFSLWTYLNSSGSGTGSACSGLDEVGTGISVLTTAVLTTEVMGVASAVRTALPRVLGSLTLCS